MPTLEQDLASAIAAQNLLTQVVANYKAQLDQSVAAQKTAYDAWIDNVKSQIPMPPNLIANAAMTKVTNGIPDGFGSVGVSIAAVSPYTKGFEGVYAPAMPAGAAASTEAATAASPFWYGNYSKGPRLANGGLADGWGGRRDGSILKITAPAGAPSSQRMLMLPISKSYEGAAANSIGLRGFIKIVKGSTVGFGDDSGYYGAPYGYLINKANSDKCPQGWMYIDFLIGLNQKSMPLDGFYVGFKSTEDIEIYLALPYAYIPMSSNPGITY